MNRKSSFRKASDCGVIQAGALAMALAFPVVFCGAAHAAHPGKGGVPSVRLAQADSTPAPLAMPRVVAPRSVERPVFGFGQLGTGEPLKLWRTKAMVGLPFSIRADEVVNGARLRLVYSYSAQAVRKAAFLKVAVNGEEVAAIPLPKDQAGVSQTQDIVFEPRLVTDYNRLSMQLVSEQDECSEIGKGVPLLTVSNSSAIELQSLRIGLANDLAQLPLPFFDKRDSRPLTLPFVLAERPGSAALEAASVLSSWFGAMAGYRGASFPTSLNRLPQGHAVVLATPEARPVGVALPEISGPSVILLNNPVDEQGKLLLVMGRDARELRAAAVSLTTTGVAASGDTSALEAVKTTRTVANYDAANWVPTDRPVKLGDLAAARGVDFSGSSGEPIRLNMRVPPDIFAWRSEGVPLDLTYRFNPSKVSADTHLHVTVNGSYVEGIRLQPQHRGWRSWFRGDEPTETPQAQTDGTMIAHKRVLVPARILTGRSHFNVELAFDTDREMSCSEGLVGAAGGIDPGSTLDFSNFPHYLPMPDLAAFGNAGYPFTRVADLSQTAAILPESPTSGDIGALLTLMGRMGQSTGTPVTGLAVSTASEIGKVADRDLLLIGSPASQPLLKDWARHMTYDVVNPDARPGLTDLWGRFVAWLKAYGSPTAKEGAGRRHQIGDAAVVGFESPLQSGRSVVAVVGNRESNLGPALAALGDPVQLANVQGSAVTVGEGGVSQLSGETHYYIGGLPWFERNAWYFSRHPVRLWIVVLLGGLLLAAVLHRGLANLAARRLRTA